MCALLTTKRRVSTLTSPHAPATQANAITGTDIGLLEAEADNAPAATASPRFRGGKGLADSSVRDRPHAPAWSAGKIIRRRTITAQAKAASVAPVARRPSAC